MEEAIALLRQLAKERFFGAITLKFESGRIMILKKEEAIKPQPYLFRDTLLKMLEAEHIEYKTPIRAA